MQENEILDNFTPNPKPYHTPIASRSFRIGFLCCSSIMVIDKIDFILPQNPSDFFKYLLYFVSTGFFMAGCFYFISGAYHGVLSYKKSEPSSKDKWLGLFGNIVCFMVILFIIYLIYEKSLIK